MRSPLSVLRGGKRMDGFHGRPPAASSACMGVSGAALPPVGAGAAASSAGLAGAPVVGNDVAWQMAW